MYRNIVSVVIPTYNREKKLPRAIDSVLRQTYQNWELLIIDDGSTDKTRHLTTQKFGNDSRVHFIERPASRPKGANSCRNIGIEKASGDYIALLDSDDEWKEDHLVDCLSLVDKEPTFFGCYSGAIIKRGSYSFERKSRSILADESYIDFLLDGGFSPTPSLFIRKKNALEVKFDESLQRHQDWDFFIRFGERYHWTFNDTVNVIINWGIDTTFKEIDFDSCIVFYEKHKKKISNDYNQVRYLYTKYKESIAKGNEEASEFYKNELIVLGVENRIPINFPRLFKLYELLKSKMQINRLKKIVKFYLQS